MKASEILDRLRSLGVALGVTDGKIELSAPTAPPDELVDAAKASRGSLLALLLPKPLFKRPQPKPPVKVVYDHRDHGPNSRLSPEAKAQGVSIPNFWGEERNRPGRGRL
jgi:hypothetical protein